MCVQRAQEARDQHCIVDVASRPVVHRHKCARSSSDPSRLFTDMAAASAVKHRLDHSIDDLTNDERTVNVLCCVKSYFWHTAVIFSTKGYFYRLVGPFRSF